MAEGAAGLGSAMTFSEVEEMHFEDSVFPMSKLTVCLPCCLGALPSCCLSECELIKRRQI